MKVLTNNWILYIWDWVPRVAGAEKTELSSQSLPVVHFMSLSRAGNYGYIQNRLWKVYVWWYTSSPSFERTSRSPNRIKCYLYGVGQERFLYTFSCYSVISKQHIPQKCSISLESLLRSVTSCIPRFPGCIIFFFFWVLVIQIY